MTNPNQPLLVDVLQTKQRVYLNILIALWIAVLAWFWYWWLQPSHIVNSTKFAFNTVLLAWTSLLPGYFFFFVSKMKKANPNLPIPPDWRIAIVVTKAPSEPWSVVKKTLIAMLMQNPAHDNWLADENPQPETLLWCKNRGIKISTRKDIAEYHQTSWPRRTKCKEGNLAYFYDNYGYANYDFVAQLDADHVPTPGYLEAILRPFHDPRIGYVSAPSICDANAKTSWSARARLFSEACMHGPLQAGYSNGFAPLCIGSHYAVRTTALKEIGGLGPELAEDHSTTLLMNAGGWKGVHALDAIANGDGPGTLADCLTQEFQWSRSLMVLLLTLTPKALKKLSWKLKLQFIFSQLWFPLFSLFMFAGHLLPLAAIIQQQPLVNISYFDYLFHSTPSVIATIFVVWFIKKQHLLRPVNAPLFSWEVVIFQFVRWPWVMLGTLSAIYQTITKEEPNFKVTPKGQVESSPLPARLVIPYSLIAVCFAIGIVALPYASAAKGYYYFSIVNILTYTAITIAVVLLHNKEQAYER